MLVLNLENLTTWAVNVLMEESWVVEEELTICHVYTKVIKENEWEGGEGMELEVE